MQKTFSFFARILSGVAFCSLMALAQGDKVPEGKKIFLENKCSSCHSIESGGITKKTDDSKSAEIKPPDLSSVGSERTGEWIGKYLQKKETIDGEKHPKKFRGSDEELAALAAWLATLKGEKKENKK